jgi:hypothetical protein
MLPKGNVMRLQVVQELADGVICALFAGTCNDRGDFLHEMNSKVKNITRMVDVSIMSSSHFFIFLIPFQGFG